MPLVSRRLVFDLHLIAGLGFGLILLIIAGTGTILLFRLELDAWANPRLFKIEPGTRTLPLDTLLDQVRKVHPDGAVSYVDLPASRERTAMFRFKGRDEVYINPYTGEVVGQRNRNDTFVYKVERLHRYLLLPRRAEAVGETITGGSALGLLLLIASGVYLWLPKSRAAWKSAFVLNSRHKGRAWQVGLHKVVGIYSAAILFISSVTGLPIAFQWFKQAFYYSATGSSAPVPPKSIHTPPDAPRVALERVWEVARAFVPEFRFARLNFPDEAGSPFEAFIVAADAPHANAGSTVHVDPTSGTVLRATPYKEYSVGHRLFLLSRPLHNGMVGGLPGRLLMLGGMLSLLALVLTGAWLFFRRKIRPAVRHRSLDARRIQTATPASRPEDRPITILYGSQTGTAEFLAGLAAKEAGKRGIHATVADIGQTCIEELATRSRVLVITSTYGEGEPPDNARALHRALHASDARSLTGLEYSVCALGDTSFPRFCQCGRDFDLALEKRGARRFAPRVDCDVDYDASFTAWLETVLDALAPGTNGSTGRFSHELATAHNGDAAALVALPLFESAGAARVASASPQALISSNRDRPFAASVLGIKRLSDRNSQKEVNHVELSLADSGLAYEVGDALGVVPQNCPDLVNDILAALGCDGEEAIEVPDFDELPIRIGLLRHFDLGKPSDELLARTGCASDADETRPLHVIDALVSARRRLALSEFAACLKRLEPRFYSIASSPRLHPGEVHLTVSAVRYEAQQRRRKGVCSTFLPDRALSIGSVPVFVRPNRTFRLPEDSDAPIIMIGPGTGVAPFRAFIEERRATGARGKNWLFFGDRSRELDFLYGNEVLAWHAEASLHRLDLAWSRDQTEKVYVQHRMLERAAELYAWLEEGAHVYVCGDASRMAKDVDAALHRVIEIGEGKGSASAMDYIRHLRLVRRYVRDVY